MSNLRHRVEKLRLRRGDILVCRDWEAAKAISEMKFPYITFQVPIVFAPGGLEAIPGDKLFEIARKARESSQIILPGKI